MPEKGNLPLIAAFKNPYETKISYDAAKLIALGGYHRVNTRKTHIIPWQAYYNKRGSRVLIHDGKIRDFPGPENDFYLMEIDGKALAVFLGTQPENAESEYAKQFIDIAQELGIGKLLLMDDTIRNDVPHTRDAYYYYTHGSRKPSDPSLYPLTDDRENAGAGPLILFQAQENGIDSMGLEIIVPKYLPDHIYVQNHPYMKRLADKAHEIIGMPLEESFLDTETREYENRYISYMMADRQWRDDIEIMQATFDHEWTRRNRPEAADPQPKVQLSAEMERFLKDLQYPHDC
ncbi:MAG: PAC2 family protein [Candidatus Aenigmarchaeota archaeon]|nr:PAC2 family protein [Candidatus Aenigmarchaeota archaeon]